MPDFSVTTCASASRSAIARTKLLPRTLSKVAFLYGWSLVSISALAMPPENQGLALAMLLRGPARTATSWSASAAAAV